MKRIKPIAFLIMVTMLAGCGLQWQENKTIKVERSIQIIRRGEIRPPLMDYDNQSTGNATDKALRAWKKEMRL